MKVKKQHRVITGNTTISRQDRLNATSGATNGFKSTITEGAPAARGGTAGPSHRDERLHPLANLSGSRFAGTLLTTERMLVTGMLPERTERLDFRDAPRQVNGNQHAAGQPRKNDESVPGEGGVLAYLPDVAGHITEDQRFNYKGSVPTRWDAREFKHGHFEAKNRGREVLNTIVKSVEDHDEMLDAGRLKGIKENVQRVQEYVAREEEHAIKVFQRENPIMKVAARKDYPPHMRSSNPTLW